MRPCLWEGSRTRKVPARLGLLIEGVLAVPPPPPNLSLAPRFLGKPVDSAGNPSPAQVVEVPAKKTRRLSLWLFGGSIWVWLKTKQEGLRWFVVHVSTYQGSMLAPFLLERPFGQ